MFNRGRGRGASLDQHATNVERILSSIGVNPQQARMSTRDGYGWAFQHGSAMIEVYITQQAQREYFQVVAPLIHLPLNNLLPLYRRLLELNLSLTNASLGIYQDVVYIFNERPLAGLDANEADFIISQIAGYADDLDNQLVNEFGGRLYTQA
ncbi:YbjN domain-containing protein [Phototrophicus methaneseepsis]|uniref:YbjN domain-containing protein n=1 Tax=Phototrophicus methaneseepsis TaxID=2710758 RepID=A0A7S8E8G4_9CHLR|nr:YbjN domain-containing protein [Phototrophicus methaneseepsis]QPC82208.1 YbjN domain-containing protein [Phototrophicus methaneseepsis]